MSKSKAMQGLRKEFQDKKMKWKWRVWKTSKHPYASMDDTQLLWKDEEN